MKLQGYLQTTCTAAGQHQGIEGKMFADASAEVIVGECKYSLGSKYLTDVSLSNDLCV